MTVLVMREAGAEKKIKKNTAVVEFAVVDASGKRLPFSYTLPNATKQAVGGVKQAAFVADPVGETPTKAEFVALRDALVASGAMASS